MNMVLFSSNSDEWYTPFDFYDKLNKEFNFTLDPCCTDANAKCEKHFTINDDGLKQNWSNETVFVNPPYSNIKEWVKKCDYETQKNNALCVMLVPSRTDTKWFHEYIYKKYEIRFIKGRLKFGGSKNSAPFPSMVVIFRK